MLSDIEIANAAELRPITRGRPGELGIDPMHLVPYGHHKAKVDLGYLRSPRRPSARGRADPDDGDVPDAGRRGQDDDHGRAGRRAARAGAQRRWPACASRRWGRCSA